MSKKLYINTTVRLVVRTDDDTDVDTLMENMDYSFSSEDGEMEDTELRSWELKDTK